MRAREIAGVVGTEVSGGSIDPIARSGHKGTNTYMADFDLTYCANVFSRDDYKLYDRMIRYDSWPEGPHLPARVPPA